MDLQVASDKGGEKVSQYSPIASNLTFPNRRLPLAAGRLMGEVGTRNAVPWSSPFWASGPCPHGNLRPECGGFGAKWRLPCTPGMCSHARLASSVLAAAAAREQSDGRGEEALTARSIRLRGIF